MKKVLQLLLFFSLSILCFSFNSEAKEFVIDPEKGSNENDGSIKSPWQNFLPLIELTFHAGDQITIKPGIHQKSLILRNGKGTKQLPITVVFMPGKHIFSHGNLHAEQLQISNTNDAPNEKKSISIKLDNMSYIRLMGSLGKTEIINEGKSIFINSYKSNNIEVKNLIFDYLHPTMGEFTVTKIEGNTMYATVGEGIQYKIDNGKLKWFGPGWEFNMGGYSKVLDISEGVFRGSFNPNDAIISEISPGQLKITYKQDKKITMSVGQAYQNRNVRRDCCGFFFEYSSNIYWQSCSIYYMHGMGVVSQFCDTITFKNLIIEPRPDSHRTSASWADNLHFSGCKGLITVEDSKLGSSHDDAINIHGTHLQIVKRIDEKHLIVKYIHGQTFGFAPYLAGDKIDLIDFNTLRPYASSTVDSIKKIDARQYEITLIEPIPETKLRDAVENVTWTPSAMLKNIICNNIPTRGFLITTRRPVVVENCIFNRTGMPGILVEDDASGWYESGFVSNLTIKNNIFNQCGEPVIRIIPHAPKPNGAVHQNIKIIGNKFILKGRNAIQIRHSENIEVDDNMFYQGKNVLQQKDCVSLK